MDCQSYPPMLADLFIAKKAAIARTHPVISILKLKSFGADNPAVYFCIKCHAVLLLQNLALLLTFLPSPTIALHDIIRIVSVGQGCQIDLDFRYFIFVRKQTTLNTLTWL